MNLNSTSPDLNLSNLNSSVLPSSGRSAVVSAVRVVPYTYQARVRGETVMRSGWWLSVTDSDGVLGRGDAATWPAFGNDPEVIEAALHQLAVMLQGRDSETIAELMRREWPVEVSHAAELAMLDIESQRAGKSIACALGVDPAPSVRIHTLVDGPSAAISAVSSGARHLKIKLPHDKRDAVALVASIAKVAPTALLRIDANASFSVAAADVFLAAVSGLNVEWLEQPVAKLADFAELRHHRVPLAADESVLSEPIADVCALADVAVIKPMYVGGPRRALALACRFADAGLQVCFTHTFESTVGRQAALCVAAAWGVGVHGVGLKPGDAGIIALPQHSTAAMRAAGSEA